MIGIDLFSGVGGMSLGATLAGVEVRVAVERDQFAGETFLRNHPGVELINRSIETVHAKEMKSWRQFGSPMIVFGGPPCQGFSWSNARTRNADNQSNWLFHEFIRVVKTLKPEWIIFENVRGIIDTAGGVFIKTIVKELEKQNYSVTMALLNAKDFGVPQDRTRFFLVGNRCGVQFHFPAERVKVPVTVSDAISDLPHLENGHSSCWAKYRTKVCSQYAKRMRGRLTGCFNNLVTRSSTLVIERYRHIPQGGNWEDIPAKLMKNYADCSRCHTGVYHRLKGDAPSLVIGNFRKNMLIHPTENRGLSVREAARIQSFPDSFYFCGSIGYQQQQVGNAVPPLLAEAVFRQLIVSAK